MVDDFQFLCGFERLRMTGAAVQVGEYWYFQFLCGFERSSGYNTLRR